MIGRRHWLIAALLHAVIAVLFLSGISLGGKRLQPPLVIEAVLLDESREDQVQREQRETERLREEETARRRQQEEERRRMQEEARQRAEAEAQRKAEAEARQRAEAEARRKAEEEARRKAAEEARKRAEDEARRKAEAEARRRAEEEERRQREEAERRQRDQDELQRRLAEEEGARQQAARATAQQQWMAQIRRHVERHWRRPAGLAQGLACQVRISLLPDGTVSNVTLVRSSGSGLFDRSAEEAVMRASPLPRPDDPAAFERQLLFTFDPDRSS
jgi:colicin import membrane protein